MPPVLHPIWSAERSLLCISFYTPIWSATVSSLCHQFHTLSSLLKGHYRATRFTPLIPQKVITTRFTSIWSAKRSLYRATRFTSLSGPPKRHYLVTRFTSGPLKGHYPATLFPPLYGPQKRHLLVTRFTPIYRKTYLFFVTRFTLAYVL